MDLIQPGSDVIDISARPGKGMVGARRLYLFALAYNLANFLRRLTLPRGIRQWSLTTLREKFVKIGAKVTGHSKGVTFQLAEVALPRQLFAGILERIRRLAMPLAVCRSG